MNNTVKLYDGNRAGIQCRLLAHKFGPEVGALMDEFGVLAADVYEDVYDVTTQRKLKRVPDGWLPRTCAVKVDFRGKVHELHFSGHDSQLYKLTARMTDELRMRQKVWRLLPNKDGDRVLRVYDARHPLARRHEELQNRVSDLRERFDRASSQVSAALRQATTVNRLKNIWPEVAPFCAHLEVADGENLPALRTKELNAALGL